MKPKLSDLWRWDGSLTGRNFFWWGLLLAVIKYNLDRFIAAVWFDSGWTIFDPETVKLYLWQSPLKEAQKPYFFTLLTVSLPFLWAGMVLTLRRLRSLGWRPFWALLFFVPVVKFIFFTVLCVLRSGEERRTPPRLENFWDRFCGKVFPRGAFTSAAFAILLTTVLAVLAAWLGTEIFRDYGWPMFIGLPFAMGFLAVLIDSFRTERSVGRCLLVANLTVPPTLPLLEVKSSVIVNAPPEKVWRNVVSFSQLPPPTEMIFKLGVAYPVRAEINGCGVGAIRHCNFSTGPFVEPITVWDEPRLLKFSVTQNPEPMQEWTPYHEIHPAHLDGYLESQAGQFRLVPLAGGRTLLEGTTWYHHHLWPADYWQLWSDQIIHMIHLRVLNHVKQLSEQAP